MYRVIDDKETHVQSNRHKSHRQCQVLSAQGGNEYIKPRTCEETGDRMVGSIC